MPYKDPRKKRERSRQYRQEHADDPEWRAKQRESQRRYEERKRLDPEWRKARVEKLKRERLRFPERAAARQAVHSAISRGELARPTSCEVCGPSETRIEAHHDDYSQPLDVAWLCKPCHVIADKSKSVRN